MQQQQIQLVPKEPPEIVKFLVRKHIDDNETYQSKAEVALGILQYVDFYFKSYAEAAQIEFGVEVNE